MDRRAFLQRAIAAGAGGAVLPHLAMATAGAQTATPGESPYGPLATEPDENGLLLPEGFTSRCSGKKAHRSLPSSRAHATPTRPLPPASPNFLKRRLLC